MINKEITPEVIEKAIELLSDVEYCCFALACALAGSTKYKPHGVQFRTQAIRFLHPLLKRDNITITGSWAIADNVLFRHLFSRKDWLRKIAQELRDGKI